MTNIPEDDPDVCGLTFGQDGASAEEDIIF